MAHYKIKLNGGNELEVSRDKDKWHINGVDFDADICQTGDLTFHVISNNRSYNVEILKAEHDVKEFVIRVNGKEYEANAQDEQDLLLQRLGMEHTASKISDLKAPMPGKVLSIHVKTGDEVQKGSPLLILEAMKMENMIKATGEGKVKTVKVKEGAAVEKGQVMLEFE